MPVAWRRWRFAGVPPAYEIEPTNAQILWDRAEANGYTWRSLIDAGADVLVAGVPSQFLRGVLQQAADHVRPFIPVVSLVKGLEQGSRGEVGRLTSADRIGKPVGGHDLEAELLLH